MSSTVSYAEERNKWNTAESASSVFTELNNTKDLRCLNLEANTLGVEAARVIGDALAKHPEFECAHWKDLFTGRLKTEIPQALKHLFSGIMRANAKLKELDLSDNALGPIGVQGMVDFIKSPSCYSLKELRLNNNGLGINGGIMLAESLIELAGNASKAGTPLKLKIFISGRNRLENNGAKIFAKFFSVVKSLEEIAMPQNGISHEGIAALAKAFTLNPQLRIVNLNDNTFTPKGASAMAAELPKITNLEVINFGDCLLKTAGAISVAKALAKDHMKLKELYLDSNEIKMQGGISVIEAIANKPLITHVMLDTNIFGNDGAEILLEMLKRMGKEDIMGSLEENEELDEDEEDENEDDDGKDESEEEENEDSDNEIGVSPMKRDSLLQPIKGTADEFLTAPSAARLLGLADTLPSCLLDMAQKRAQNVKTDIDHDHPGSAEALIYEYIRVFMTVSSFSTSVNQKVLDLVDNCTRELAREAFTVATKSGNVSVATNCFLVHFGLVKSEDKKFKIESSLKGGAIALSKIIPESFFPSDTKSILQYFFSKPGLQIGDCSQEKHILLSSLFKAI